MYIHDRVPLLVGHFLDHAVPGIAGVVDDDVDALIFAQRRADEAIRKVGRGHAAATGGGLTTGGAEFIDDLLGWFGIEIVDDHPCTLGREFMRDGATDAAARSGNECYLAC